MRNTWKLAWAACLVSTLAFGDGPLPDSGLYLGPKAGANLFTFAWPGGSQYGTELTPSVRGSFFFPSFAVGADLGASAFVGPFAYGGYDGALNLSAEVMPFLTQSGSTRTYGLAGLDLGMNLSVPFARAQRVYPKAGFTLGLGIQHFVAPDFVIGAEAGARTQFLAGSDWIEPTTSLFISFIGQWNVWGTQAREKVPATTERPGTAPPPPPTNAPPPSQPIIYGHSTTPCTTYATEGWFEPTQGVWQDDPSFDDKKGKQLTRLPGDGRIAYEAELNMVMNKDTLLFGVHHYRKDGELVPINDRNDIVLMGYTNCTINVPVKFKFTRQDAVESLDIYTSPVITQVPLDGPAAPDFKRWAALLPAPTGIPPDRPFRFERNLPFTLKAELIRDDTGAPTGLQMTVNGYPQPSMGPKVHFVPVFLTAATGDEGDNLIKLTEYLASDTAKFVPDLFPIAPDGLPTNVKSIRSFADREIPEKWFEFRRYGALVAALNDSLAASTFLEGAGRTVAVMRGKDFEAIFGEGAAAMTVPTSVSPEPKGPDAERLKPGRSLSWKVMMMPSTAMWDTVAHELVHTLPDGWTGSDMKSLCGRDYHNEKDPIAHGVQIDDAGQPVAAREVKASKIPLMGPEVVVSKMWITQCTYWHLLYELGGVPPDPPVVMLRAWLGKQGATLKGELKPAYNLMGHSDLAAGKGGQFAFVLRDAKGLELGRFPFTPRWNDLETKEARDIVSVVYRVPDLPGWAQVELVGPFGVLDRRTRSPKAPELTITAPADQAQVTPQNGKIHVTWRGDGDPLATLLYTVLYSPDGGNDWLEQSFEQKGTAFDLKIDPKGKSHQVKIVVTDGTRSAEAVTRFSPRP